MTINFHGVLRDFEFFFFFFFLELSSLSYQFTPHLEDILFSRFVAILIYFPLQSSGRDFFFHHLQKPNF